MCASQFLSGQKGGNSVKAKGMSATCQIESCHCNHTEPSESLSVKAARLADCLEKEIRSFMVASDQNLGDIELGLEQQSRELLRTAAAKAAQQKADLTPP